MKTIRARRVRMEVARPRNGHPGYVWVEGVTLLTDDGRETQPYLRIRDAQAYCRAEGWRLEILPCPIAR